MRCSIILLGLMGALLASAPSQAAVFSLAQAMGIAYETNPRLDGARAALRALDEGVAQANAGWRPSVNASGSYGVERGTIDGFAAAFNSHPLIGQVTVTEPVFRGGRTYAEVGQAISQVKAGRASLTSVEQDVLLAAVTAYMDVVRDGAILRFNQDNISALSKEAEAVHTMLAAGAVTRTDASQAEARLAKAQSDEAGAEQQFAASRAAFENVIGRPPESLEQAPPVPRLPETSDAALAVALAQHPDVLQAKSSARAADYAVDDANGALLPQIAVSGQYQYLRDAAGTNIFGTKRPQQVMSVVGQVTVPIYQAGGDEATVRRAKEVRQQSTIAIASAERNVRENVSSAWQAVRSAQTAIGANEAQVNADKKAVESATQEQQAGERSVIDVLNAQQELVSAQVALAASRHDNVVAAYRLMSAMGQLTARTLGLHVQTYDPRTHYDDDADAWVGFGD
ncbi:MAG TPA: TolC family outer membrane protein [Rhizomicrobium sp.]|nr:TolC family outer membrane protein [Rhizomicrobium sp.]